VPALSAVLDKEKEPDSIVRGSAANALGMIGDRSAVLALSAVLEKDREPNAIVRGSAISGCLMLFDSDDPKLFQLLQATYYHDPDPVNRTNAIRGLGWSANSRAIETCKAALWDKDPGVRGESARALARLASGLNRDQQEDIASTLIRFWSKCQRGSVLPSVSYAVASLPPEIVAPRLQAIEATLDLTSRDKWRLRSWTQLQERVSLATRCESQIEEMRKEERAYCRRFWGLS